MAWCNLVYIWVTIMHNTMLEHLQICSEWNTSVHNRDVTCTKGHEVHLRGFLTCNKQTNKRIIFGYLMYLYKSQWNVQSFLYGVSDNKLSHTTKSLVNLHPTKEALHEACQEEVPCMFPKEALHEAWQEVACMSLYVHACGTSSLNMHIHRFKPCQARLIFTKTPTL